MKLLGKNVSDNLYEFIKAKSFKLQYPKQDLF